MTTMRQAAEDYLALRRSMGFQLAVPGRQVQQFADYLDALAATHVTIDLAVAWATQPAGAAPSYHWLRLNAVRGFAGYLHGIDPAHQVPPADLLPRENHRPSPYLLSAADIAGLIDAAGTLRPALHAATYQTLIGVLAVAGLRPSEALTLDLTDVDLHNGVLTVHGKYGKTREIMLHPSTVSELAGYAQLRDRMFPHRADVSFFVSVRGSRLNLRRVHYVYARLTRRAGLLPDRGGARRSR
jgi:integrase